jgi:hypothetical protein
MSGTYKCKHCDKSVNDRHPYVNERCRYSPTDKHEWYRNSDGFENDTKWSESFVGKNWKWLLVGGAIVYILYKLGVI